MKICNLLSGVSLGVLTLAVAALPPSLRNSCRRSTWARRGPLLEGQETVKEQARG